MSYLTEEVRLNIRLLSDENLEIEQAKGDHIAFDIPATLLADFRKWRREIEAEIRRRKAKTQPLTDQVPTNWQMYTDKGDALVTAEMKAIAILVDRGTITDATRLKVEFEQAYERLSRGKGSGEVGDTEPRGDIRDFADLLAAAKGWQDPYAGYGDRFGDRLAL